LTDTFRLSWKKDGFASKVYLTLDAYIEVFMVWLVWLTETSPDHLVETRINRLGAMSALSSTLYSVAGTAKSKFVSTKPQTYHWLLLGVMFYSAVRVSDRMVKLAKKWEIELSPNQLDIRQSILRRANRLDDALECIGEALEKLPEPSMTKCLLLAGMAEVHTVLLRQMKSTRPEILAIVGQITENHERANRGKLVEPGQTVRVYRMLAVVHERIGDHEKSVMFRGKAFLVAQSHGLHDQIAKLHAEMVTL
jgi:hypothetical protein